MNRTRPFLPFLVVSFAFIAGCSSGSDQPELAEVSGTVTMDGEPLTGVQVMFGPESGRTSMAFTNEEGYYELMYLMPDTPGAKIGKHTVSISTPFEDEDESDPSAEFFVDPIPKMYHSKTILTAEVKAGDNEINYSLTSK